MGDNIQTHHVSWNALIRAGLNKRPILLVTSKMIMRLSATPNGSDCSLWNDGEYSDSDELLSRGYSCWSSGCSYLRQADDSADFIFICIQASVIFNPLVIFTWLGYACGSGNLSYHLNYEGRLCTSERSIMCNYIQLISTGHA